MKRITVWDSFIAVEDNYHKYQIFYPYNGNSEIHS